MDEQTPLQQAVIIYFRVDGDARAPISGLVERLETALSVSGSGACDGHETDLLDGDDGYVFLSGPDADVMYEAIRPIVESCTLLRGGEVTLRYGGPDDDLAPVRRLAIAS